MNGWIEVTGETHGFVLDWVEAEKKTTYWPFWVLKISI